MVFTNQGMPSGPLSDEYLDRLRLARYGVIGLWLCTIGRFIFDSPFNGLSTCFAAITGTYTFMNDKRLEGCYEFMHRNLTLCGSGGNQCMGPFLVICLINAVFDLFRFGSIWNAGLLSIFPGAALAVFSSIVLQAYCFYACLGIYKELMHPFEGVSEGRSYVRLADETGSQAPSGFVPFSGRGRRLG
jgi:hypothetical protein